MTSDINVAGVERWASALGGAALAAYGIRQLKDRSPSGAALTQEQVAAKEAVRDQNFSTAGRRSSSWVQAVRSCWCSCQ